MTMGYGLRRTAFDRSSYDFWTNRYQVVNVKDFGATGDGVHDDTAAIQAAFDAVASAGGGITYLAAGTYLVSKRLVIGSKTVVTGEHRYASTILAQTGGSWTAPTPATWPFILGAVNGNQITVQDLGINANGQNASGICIVGGDDPVICNCFVFNGTAHTNIHFFGAQTTGVNPVRRGIMSSNVSDGSLYGFAWDGAVHASTMQANHSINAAASHFSWDGRQGVAGGIVAGSAINNIVDDEKNPNALGSAMQCFDAYDAVVTNNIFTNLGQPTYGIYGENYEGIIQGNTVSGRSGAVIGQAIHCNPFNSNPKTLAIVEANRIGFASVAFANDGNGPTLWANNVVDSASVNSIHSFAQPQFNIMRENYKLGDAGNTNIDLAQPLISMSGPTAGNVFWQQPGRDPNRFLAYFDGYENDTTTNQTITFPTAYTYTPTVSTNSTGLTVSASTTELTITSPNSTTTYSGVVEVVGL